VPKSLRVFLDEAELGAAPNVRAELEARLAPARFLVVLCTPRTPASQWIETEIEIFQRDRPNRIITVLKEGPPEVSIPRVLFDPANPDRQALYVNLSATAARPGVEFLRLMATLLGCELDQLVRRERQRRKRRYLVGTVTGVMIASALWYYEASNQTRVSDLRNLADSSRAELVELSEQDRKAEHRFLESLIEERNEVPVGSLLRILRRQQFPTRSKEIFARDRLEGDLAADSGHTEDAMALYRRSLDRLRTEAAGHPSESLRRELVLGLDRLGDSLCVTGDLPGSAAAYAEGVTMARTLPSQDPDARRVLAFVLTGEGDLYLAAGRLTDALATYTEAQELRSRVDDGRDLDPAVDAAVAQLKVGDAQATLAAYDLALHLYSDARDRLEGLLSPRILDKRLRSFAALAHQRVGHALLDIGRHEAAVAEFTAGHRLLEDLKDSDPENQAAQFEFMNSYRWLGDGHVANGRTEEAVTCYQESLAGLQRLTGADPANRNWSVAMARVRQRLGDAEWRRGDAAAAEGHFRTAIVILRDTKSDSGLDELASANARLGLLLCDHGRSDEGRKLTLEGLRIQVAKEATTLSLRDRIGVADDHGRVAIACSRLGLIDEALEHQRKSAGILDEVSTTGAAASVWQQRCVVAYCRLSDLLGDSGALLAARMWAERAVDTADKLVAVSPGHVPWRRTQASALTTLGDRLLSSRDFVGAEQRFLAARSILSELTERNGDTETQAALAWLLERLGDVAWENEDLHPAIDLYKRSLVVREALARSQPLNVDYANVLALNHRWLGELLVEDGRPSEAVPHLTRAVEDHDRIRARQPSNRRWEIAIGVNRIYLAAAYAALGHGDKAWRELLLAEQGFGPMARMDDDSRYDGIKAALQVARMATTSLSTGEARALAMTWAERGVAVLRDRLERLTKTVPGNDTKSDDVARLRGQLQHLRDVDPELRDLRTDPRFAKAFAFLDEAIPQPLGR